MCIILCSPRECWSSIRRRRSGATALGTSVDGLCGSLKEGASRCAGISLDVLRWSAASYRYSQCPVSTCRLDCAVSAGPGCQLAVL